jgi:gas vesicle protein
LNLKTESFRYIFKTFLRKEEQKMNDQDNKKQEVNSEAVKKDSDTRVGGRKFAGVVAAALFSGVVIGIVTGVLFAPKKGKQTRKDIADKSKELVERSKKTVTDTIDKTKEFTSSSKEKIDKVIKIVTPDNKKKEKKDK